MMTEAYWNIGKRIVEDDQSGSHRVEYGKAIIKNFSEKLIIELGKGFWVDDLENMRKFSLVYSIFEKVSRKFVLSWVELYLFIKNGEY